MKFQRLALLLLAFIWLGCSDDDNNQNNENNENNENNSGGISSILVVPDSAVIPTLGEDLQLAAVAQDANGDSVMVSFTWSSSDESVATVNDHGLVTSVTEGDTLISASAGGVTGTSSIEVTLIATDDDFVWLGGDGDWSDPTKWASGSVPGVDDEAIIDAEGTYTVSLDGPTSVASLNLGNAVGAQTLNLGGQTLTLTDANLIGGAILSVEGKVELNGNLNWISGTIAGDGDLNVNTMAVFNVDAGSETVQIDSNLLNFGRIRMTSGTLDIRGNTVNYSQGSPSVTELLGDSVLFVNTGAFINEGNIAKPGTGAARIQAAGADFTSPGSIEVLGGSLELSGGTISGSLSVADESTFILASTVNIPKLIQTGEGTVRLTGAIVVGADAPNLVTLSKVVLDSTMAPEAVTGDGALRVSGDFAWTRGDYSAVGALQTSGTVTLDGSSPISITGGGWLVTGTVDATATDISLGSSADLTVETVATWNQNGGGDIKLLDGASLFDVYGNFNKLGAGAFNVAPDFRLNGTADLQEGVVVSTGDFYFTEVANILGGGTDPTMNLRLNVDGATGARLDGTITVGGDDFERFDILGAVTLSNTFTVNIGVNRDSAIQHDTLTFQTPGTVMAGTVELTVGTIPFPNDSHQVIATTTATGMFTVNGGQAFTGIVQDANGLLLTRD